MSNTEVAIVVLNYQTPDLTFACVRSLEGEIDADCRVVVVDNGSGDDSAELLANAIADWGFAGWAQVVRSPVAAGVAEGARLGIRALPARAYVLIDGKTIVVPGTIRELRKVMRSHPDAGVLGVHVLDGDDAAALTAFRMTGPSGGPSTMARRTAPPSGVVPTLFEQPAEVERVSGECRLLRRELVESVSARNEESRPLFEGGDQGDAARRAGLKVLFVPSARVLRRRDGRQGGTTRVNGGHEPASRHQDADARGPAVSPAVLSSLPPPSPRVAGRQTTPTPSLFQAASAT